MTVSQIPFLKSKLMDLIAGEDQLADVKAFYGRPQVQPNEFIVVTDTDEWEAPWAGIGSNRARDESFSLVAYISSRTQGKDQQTATERTFEIYGYLEELIVSHATLEDNNGTVLVLAIRPKDFTEIALTEGYAGLIEAQIACTSRL